MYGYCGICRQQRPGVNWNELTQQFECRSHEALDDLTSVRTPAPHTEIIDNRSVHAEESSPGADWSEVNKLCADLATTLDINDPRYEIENYRRAQEALRAKDYRRLVHTPNCNVTIALNNPGWMGNRTCDCKAEWK